MGKNDYEDSLLISGWNIGEGGNRWSNEKESTLRLVTNDDDVAAFTFEALTLKEPQKIKIFLDEKILGEVSISTKLKEYRVPVNYYLNQGVHKIKLIYSNNYRPIDVIPGNVDSRTLYVNFKEIK